MLIETRPALIRVVPLLLAACASSKSAEPPVQTTDTAATPQLAAEPEVDLYAPEQALEDVLSGEWEYLGTGPWPGIERSHACGFRNDRVLIVNVYCTITETQAFRLDVFSPARGRARIYAEAKGPISKGDRNDYFIFMAETEPPPSPEAGLPAVALTMSFQDLQAYDKRRYDAFLPGCYGGERHSEKVGNCLGALAPQAQRWAALSGRFLEKASTDWYRVIQEMRPLAKQHGMDPK